MDKMAATALTRSMSMTVFGPSKVGKTTFLASAPAPRLLLDVEKSSRFIQTISPILWNPKSPPPDPTDDIFDEKPWDTAIVRVTNWSQWQQTWQWLESGKHPFNSVLLDSITELQVLLIDGLVGDGQLTQQQWGTVLRKLTGMLRDLRDLTEHPIRPVEVVAASALEKSYGGVLKPMLQGAAVDTLPYLLDGLFYLTRDSKDITTRQLLTRSTDFIWAGSRTEQVLPRVMENPTIPHILDAVFGPKDS